MDTGGPTGEVHELDEATGAIGQKIQQLLFVPEKELDKADKTKVALRYGSHAVEFSSEGFGFIPVLGTNSIEVYRRTSALLKHVGTTVSPREHDGPRHLVVSPNGLKLYSITEHTNYIDVYNVSKDGALTYLQSKSIIPPHLRASVSSYRGDTLRLTPPTPSNPSPRYLFATTRGATPQTKGWLAVFRLDDHGNFFGDEDGVERWETPTSGGKANAIELLQQDQNENGVWVVLTDDDESVENGNPGLRVLEWNGWETGGVRVVAEWPDEDIKEPMRGGSHALWLD
ncbi:hypothetical protein ONZ45_g13350 [Pleurotus djamor]|nr:hypothetical protein ONZ45_g13350 [Pleurotus djamor]